MKISDKGLGLIKHYESLHDGDLSVIGLQPKMCPAGIWTVGYGRALKDSSGNWLRGIENKQKAYAMYPILNEKEALKMLHEDCDVREIRVSSLKLQLKQHEFDAMVSFVYNVGFTKLQISSLLKRIKARLNGDMNYGSDEKITSGFLMWKNAFISGHLRPLPGLIRRRRSEAHLFLAGELKFYFND